MGEAAFESPERPGVVVIDRCSGPGALEVGQAILDRLSYERGTFRVSITPALGEGFTEIVIDRLEGGAWCLVSRGKPVEELRRINFHRVEAHPVY
jgi:hypothetical protein